MMCGRLCGHFPEQRAQSSKGFVSQSRLKANERRLTPSQNGAHPKLVRAAGLPRVQKSLPVWKHCSEVTAEGPPTLEGAPQTFLFVPTDFIVVVLLFLTGVGSGFFVWFFFF